MRMLETIHRDMETQRKVVEREQQKMGQLHREYQSAIENLGLIGAYRQERGAPRD
jgi:flagellar biosynthesis chaperone FliJ